jgi:hypothetical protein
MCLLVQLLASTRVKSEVKTGPAVRDLHYEYRYEEKTYENATSPLVCYISSLYVANNNVGVSD